METPTPPQQPNDPHKQWSDAVVILGLIWFFAHLFDSISITVK